MGNLPPGFIPSLPGIGKADFGIGAKGKLFLFLIETILEPPQLTARGSNQEEKAPSIK